MRGPAAAVAVEEDVVEVVEAVEHVAEEVVARAARARP
jgi:hypothetical protein